MITLAPNYCGSIEKLAVVPNFQKKQLGRSVHHSHNILTSIVPLFDWFEF